MENENDLWQMQWEWVEPIAFRCMFQPSATRDRFILVATNALQQAGLTHIPGSPDVLLGDSSKSGNKASFPKRWQKERQLQELCVPWARAGSFLDALVQLNDSAHRQVTKDFRNKASHGIAPRFSAGYTAAVTRCRTQRTKLVGGDDGTFAEVPVPGERSTAHSFGGTPPLSMLEAFQENRRQAEIAKRAFYSYTSLFTQVIGELPNSSEDCRDAKLSSIRDPEHPTI